jgi:hypothetical protein
VTTIITDFSNVYSDFARFVGNEVIDCSMIEGTNCILDQEAEKRLLDIIRPLRTDGGETSFPQLHWLDSGDYHYLSKLWMDGIGKPFTLVLLDHHPDMQEPQFGNMLSCGSWVRAAKLSNPNMEKVVMFGVADELLTEADETYATCVCESKIKGLSPYNLEELISTIDIGRNIYLSVDKDVMSNKYAATNWDQGTMSLLQLEAIVNKILERRRLLGVDICGELSESKGGSAEESLLNVRTNLELQSFFEKRLNARSY